MTLLSEDVFYFAHQSTALRTVLHPGGSLEFQQQLALSLVQLAWGLHPHFDEEIAFAVPVEYGHTLAADAQRRTRLSPFGHFQNVLAFERRNADFGAEGGLRERNRDDAVQIVSFPLEERMLLHVQHDV